MSGRSSGCEVTAAVEVEASMGRLLIGRLLRPGEAS